MIELKKSILSIFLTVLIFISSLTGCASIPEESDEYEPVARLYTEMLWREIEESDNETLKMCSESVKEKIRETNEKSKEMRRKSKYLTKDEVHQLVGDLGEYYQNQLDVFLSLQEMARFYGEPALTEDDYEPVMILTKDTYEVTPDGKSGYITLETGARIYCDMAKEYSGQYDIEKQGFENGIYKYKITLDDDTEFFIYMDVKNGKVQRLKEAES